MERSATTPSFEVPQTLARAAELALDRKAGEVIILDLRSVSSATDFFLIGTGASDIQVKAIAEHVMDELESEGVRPHHVEGTGGGRWILIDYIDFVVHIFHPAAREFYQLEYLWGDAPQLQLGE